MNSEFLDTVGVWVNGVQATVNVGNGTASIGNINSAATPNLYKDNTLDQFNTEMDGLTVTLTFVAPVNPGVPNTIKLGVADTSDPNYDTNFLIAGGSIQSSIIAQDDSANIGLNSSKIINVLGNDSTTAGTLTVTHINGIAVGPGGSVTLTSGQTVILNADGTLTVLSDGDVETAYFTYTINIANFFVSTGCSFRVVNLNGRIRAPPCQHVRSFLRSRCSFCFIMLFGQHISGSGTNSIQNPAFC